VGEGVNERGRHVMTGITYLSLSVNLAPDLFTKSDDHLALFPLVVRVGRADTGEKAHRREKSERARVREYM